MTVIEVGVCNVDSNEVGVCNVNHGRSPYAILIVIKIGVCSINDS